MTELKLHNEIHEATSDVIRRFNKKDSMKKQANKIHLSIK